MSFPDPKIPQRIRVLVVEDEPDIRELMAMHIGREGFETVAVDDGEKGLKYLNSEPFDLAVIDWMLPHRTGLEICRATAGRVPILMVTARADTSDIVRGLEAGADDYITKPFDIGVFLARIRALLRRSQTSPGEKDPNGWYYLGSLKLHPILHKVFSNGEELKLTVSEFRLLSALMANRGRVLSRQGLIDLVQGPEVTVTDRTIDTHVFGLRKKLGPAADHIETIRGVGYRVKNE